LKIENPFFETREPTTAEKPYWANETPRISIIPI